MADREGPRWLARLAASDDTPRRTAAAFALGVFLSFSPFLGLQTIVGLSLAVALRLSRVAVLIGLCVNLPWIMVPWYTMTTAAAAYLMGVPIAVEFRSHLAALFELSIFRTAFWTGAVELVWPFLGPFVVGSTAGALVAGALAYAAFRPIVEAARGRRLAREAEQRAADRHVDDAQRARFEPEER